MGGAFEGDAKSKACINGFLKMKSIFFSLVFLISAANIAFAQNYEAIALNERKIVALKKDSIELNCKLDFEYEFLRRSIDGNFVIFKFSAESFAGGPVADSGFLDLSDAYKKCKNGEILNVRRVPNQETIVDINKMNGLYATAKEDIYSIGGGATQSYVGVAVRRIIDSKEILFPFSVLKSDGVEISRKKSYLNTPLVGAMEKGLLESLIMVFSVNGRYIYPLGFDCETQRDVSQIFSVETRKILKKEKSLLVKEDAKKECSQTLGKKLGT